MARTLQEALSRDRKASSGSVATCAVRGRGFWVRGLTPREEQRIKSMLRWCARCRTSTVHDDLPGGATMCLRCSGVVGDLDEMLAQAASLQSQ